MSLPLTIEQRTDLNALLRKVCPHRPPTWEDMVLAGWVDEIVCEITGQSEWISDPTGKACLEWNGKEWCFDNEDWTNHLPVKRTQWDHICEDTSELIQTSVTP